MRALCEALGNPERSFRSLHVVGTNGKSSVTLMCAALLEDGGVRTGACISPHLGSWAERTRIGTTRVADAAFRSSVAEVAAAVAEVERGGERITQFEAAIAASLVAFRDGRVEVAVIEAGLGGRLDATNVIASSATALTSVALDHTDWLGETVAEIAAEKLAVVEPGTVLVTGRLEPATARLAAEHAERLGARLVVADRADPAALPAHLAPYQRRNAAVAIELAATVADRLPGSESVRVLGELELEGRAELIEGDPPLIADAAHNAEGARALREALDGLATQRPLFGCVSMLADKDAAAIAAELAPALALVVCTAAEPGPAMGRPGAAALAPAELAAHFRQAGAATEEVDQPELAVGRAIDLAKERGGMAVCAGSNYLLRHVWTVRQDRSSYR